MKKWRFLVPNFFTASSFVLGLAAILLAMEGNIYLSAWCILWCVLLDKADGTAARLLKADSLFGTQFDSLADLICFGLAPAVLTYSAGRQAWNTNANQLYWWLLVIGCGLYALFAAMRLARFNTTGFIPGRRHYFGIPSTLCGALVASALLVGMKYELFEEILRNMPIFLGLLGIGMASHLPVPKLLPRKNKSFNYFQLANVVAIYLCGFSMSFPEYILGLALLYLVVGTLHGMVKGPQTVQQGSEKAESA